MYGHDGFLLEFAAIEHEIKKFMPAWQTEISNGPLERTADT
jgi:hypothetical protein